MINLFTNLFTNLYKEGFSNPYILGVLMIIINIGSRYVIEEFEPNQKKIINNSFFRKILILCVFLLATKNLQVTFILGFIFFIILNHTKEQEKKEEQQNITKSKILDDIKLVLSKYNI